MTFDDLQQTWSNEPVNDLLDAPDELRDKAIAIANDSEWRAMIFEFWAIGVFGVLGLCMMADAIRTHKPWHAYPAPLITVAISAFVFFSRRIRRQHFAFTGCLREIVEKRLTSVETQISRVTSFVWWFVVPITLAVGIQFVFADDERPLWTWPIIPLGVLAVWVSMMMEMKASHFRHREGLKSVLDQLTQDDIGTDHNAK